MFPEKRRPRTFGPDSDSLAPRSSGESDSFLLYSIHIPRACIERKLITHTYTYTYTHNHIYITRINSRITPRVMRIVTHVQAHVHVFCQLLSLRRWCMEPSTFSPLSLSFFSLVVLWLDLLLTLTAETLKIAFACSPFVDGLRGESNREIFPESSSLHARVSNRQIAAVGKIIVYPRTSEIIRTKGTNARRNVLQRLIIRNKSAIIYNNQRK